MKKKYLKLVFLFFIAVFLVGCGRVNASEIQEQNDTCTVSNLKVINTGIDLKVGTLNINSSNDNNVSSKITFGDPKWKPIVKSMKDNYGEDIDISEPVIGNIDKGKNTIMNNCDLSISKNVPTNMKIKSEAGDVKADLRELQLSNLDVNMGSGKLYLNVSGNYKKDITVNLNCGRGESTIYFPKNIGVKVEIKKHSDKDVVNLVGLMNSEEGIYTNSNYGKSSVTLYATVSTSSGKINLNVD
ncbi:hypothetical protein ACJDT4_17580 [Clostridium neuense]|uniref:Adhesin domain-containing protein n=1 Tax=Clostridium neuense TaxID=1728934 RepID=A0ABW8TIU3_9CLOT